MAIWNKKVASWGLVLLLAFPPASALGAESTVQTYAIGTSPVASDLLFQDVGNHWAANAIYNMGQYGIISGYEDHSFRPENSISREELAVMLAKAFSMPLASAGLDTSYMDIASDRWSAPYIEAARKVLYGHFSDTPLNEFGPLSPVTREQFAAALVKALGYSGQSIQETLLDNSFRDAGEITIGYRGALATAVNRELIDGKSNGMLAPKALISRAEVASLLYRALQQEDADGEQLPEEIRFTVPEETTDGSIEISGLVPEGSSVAVNGRSLTAENGRIQALFQMWEEGLYNVVISIHTSDGKSHVLRKAVIFRKENPKITLGRLSSTATRNQVEISGKVSYKNGEFPSLSINGTNIELNRYGEFAKDFSLEEGDNLFSFRAVSQDGRVTEMSREVRFTAPPPVLNAGQIPSVTKTGILIITGSVKDINDKDVMVYVNEMQMKVDELGSFTATIQLSPGKNTIKISSQNKYMKVSTVTKTVEWKTDQ